MTSGITELGVRLFKACDERGIRYCHWKNNHTIAAGLAGKDDLDLLVAREDAQSLFEVLTNLGFREAVNRLMAIPFVFHFYGLDDDTGCVIHTHIYLRLYTGESHTKNFHFPFEKQLLESSRQRILGCPVPSWEWQLLVYLIRYYLKISCGIGLLLQRNRQMEFRYEYTKIIEELAEDRWIVLLNNIKPPLTPQIIESLQHNYNNKGPTLRGILIGLRLRWRLSAWRRFGIVKEFVCRYWQIVYRALNKVFFRRRKKLIRGGVIIAVTGFDGTGKTTTCNELRQWLGKQFDVRLKHFGRPKPRLVTMPVRLLLELYRAKSRSRSRSKVVKRSNKSLIAAVRYTVLAYERYAVLRQAAALRDKGFIVVLDRYPSVTVGGMDSPQLSKETTMSGTYRFMASVESWLYSSMPEADLLLQLEVPIDVALQRNRDRKKKYKESDEELRARHEENYGLEYMADRVQTIDVSESLQLTMKEIKAATWAVL